MVSRTGERPVRCSWDLGTIVAVSPTMSRRALKDFDAHFGENFPA